MTLSEYLKNEELARLIRVWRDLKPWQRKLLLARIYVRKFDRWNRELSRHFHNSLQHYIQRRRASWAYQFPAHWL